MGTPGKWQTYYTTARKETWEVWDTHRMKQENVVKEIYEDSGEDPERGVGMGGRPTGGQDHLPPSPLLLPTP